ncbi:WD40-repeat-containing domain protein [Bombardia bombarda]|uniref:WD40-repeat-containing domain protein n=1 Tax=Bombardia bombarda TaxID=252184 RepID=A0AA39TMB6_9PEZI|nr:WD40-repeat-containing domain protein [Bombardia bombarda]
MNTRPPIESPSPTVVLSITFNDDCSCFAVGHSTGFCIYHSGTCQLKASRDFNAGIGLVQMMGKANYLGIVGGGSLPKFATNKLILWDDLKSKPALEISALTPVRGVQLSKERIVVVLQNSVRVYKFAKPPSLVAAYETAANLWGACCMSQRRIAFPGRTPGHVQLVEIATGNVSIIPAHSSALRAIGLSRDGELLATASEMGTLIRVFSTASCARVCELRRGIDPAAIFSLAFSPSGAQLACTSDKSTLHVFDVPGGRRGGINSGGGNAQPGRQTQTQTGQQQQQQQQQQGHMNAPPGPRGPRLMAASNNNAGGVTDTGGFGGIVSGGGASSVSGGGNTTKWGILSKLPLMPRMFSDVYSFASVAFEAGQEPLQVGGIPISSISGSTTLGTSRPPKGVIGWLDEGSLLVVGGGQDARWERFVIQQGQDGNRVCVREGWKRYLGST